MYSITMHGGRVAELFLTDSAPEGAVPISDESGEALRRSGRFGDYAVSAEGVVIHDPLPDRAALKAERAATVERIRVTTAAGNTFDGDESSQGRMSRAIIGLQAAGPGATINWVLADNTVIAATAAELTEALVLAGQAQAAVWVIA